MAMIDIKFTKFDNRPWGFRLAGGSDFPEPLTVIKVTEGNLAECMGLKAGDIIESINNQSILEMTHRQAQEAINLAGNNFVLGIKRVEDPIKIIEGIENKVAPYMLPIEEILFAPVKENRELIPNEIPIMKIDSLLQSEQQTESLPLEIYLDKSSNESSEVICNKNLTDQEISQIILDEEEILNEKGILGVNFNKLKPRIDLLKQSKVFQELQEQLVSESMNMQHQKQQTTFLQKPERQIPRVNIESEKIESHKPYHISINKQPKKTVIERLMKEGILEPLKLENFPKGLDIAFEMRKSVEVRNNLKEKSIDEVIEKPSIAVDMDIEIMNEEHQEKIVEQLNKDISFERELASVQTRLLALKRLPSEIEKHLEIVSDQLCTILGRSLHDTKVEVFENMEENVLEESADRTGYEIDHEYQNSFTYEEECDLIKVDNQKGSLSLDSSTYTSELIFVPEASNESKDLQIVVNSNEHDDKSLKKFIVSYESKLLQEPESSEHNISAQSDSCSAVDLKLILQDHALEEIECKKGRKYSGKLLPQPQAKQLELTFGRRWKCPNDFYNDDVIADVISSQTEIIRGKTLGVNFKKFEKMALPNYDHLIDSSVFKIVHKIEAESTNGISARPPKVLAAEDIIETVSMPIFSVAEKQRFED